MKPAPIQDSVQQLNRDMAAKGLEGHWNLGLEDLPPYPVTSIQPYLWRWADVNAHDSGSSLPERMDTSMLLPLSNMRLVYSSETISRVMRVRIIREFMRPGIAW